MTIVLTYLPYITY